MRWAVVLVSLGCGRVAFDARSDATQAGDGVVDGVQACTGDLIVDTAADDPGLALACQGNGCSLRSALAIAALRPTTTICFAGQYAIAAATPLDVSSDVTIVGQGSSICAVGMHRVLSVSFDSTAKLRDLTVCGGRLVDDAGAGVLVKDRAVLDLDRVVLDDNAVYSDAIAQEGGAISALVDSSVTIRRSRFTNNRVDQNTSSGSAYARGGAVAMLGGTGTLVISDTTFEGNTTSNVGGALFLAIDGNNITIERALFAHNESASGGAVDVNCALTNRVTIASSSFVENRGNDQIYVCGDQTLRLEFCSAIFANGPIIRTEATSIVELHGSAFAVAGFDVCTGPGTATSLGFNVADHADALCTMTGPNDKIGEPRFLALADNGGLTQTMALMPTSAAIDAAGTSCPATDQRGFPRPLGTACDAGAFESE